MQSSVDEIQNSINQASINLESVRNFMKYSERNTLEATTEFIKCEKESLLEMLKTFQQKFVEISMAFIEKGY